MSLGFTIGPPIGNVIVVVRLLIIDSTLIIHPPPPPQVAGYGAPFWSIGGFTFCLVPLTFLLVKETSGTLIIYSTVY